MATEGAPGGTGREGGAGEGGAPLALQDMKAAIQERLARGDPYGEGECQRMIEVVLEQEGEQAEKDFRLLTALHTQLKGLDQEERLSIAGVVVGGNERVALALAAASGTGPQEPAGGGGHGGGAGGGGGPRVGQLYEGIRRGINERLVDLIDAVVQGQGDRIRLLSAMVSAANPKRRQQHQV